MSMHLRHAGMVVGDVTFYRKFKADCRNACTLDEQYAQTLLHTLDPTVRTECTPSIIFTLIVLTVQNQFTTRVEPLAYTL